MKQPSVQALNLVLEYEVGGGKDYYNKYLTHPTWPGGHSGLTLGIGIDCGYYTSDELGNLFSFLPAEQLNVVKNASGKVGESGKAYVRSDEVKKANITVTWDQAVKLFDELTWPKFARLAERAFPGLDQLCDNAYGALVSLVFNRGTAMQGDSRLEMRNIRVLVPKRDYKGIAQELRKMKRIWEGKGLDGLLARREAEAKLVETCS
jgi:GH24 family phage-related lysozyme (muramidase)